MTRAQTRYSHDGVVLEHQCPACGDWYKPNRRDQVYCDQACRQAGHRQRKKFQERDKPDPLDWRSTQAEME